MKRRKLTDIRTQAQDWKNFAQEFQDESDRAAALLGAAWLDVRLHQLLENFFVDDPKAVAPLFQPQGPLESFGVRIRVAYALGLVSQMSFHDLMLIKDIRSSFAHDLHGMSFSDDQVTQACRSLKTPWKASPAGAKLIPRKLHEIAVSLLANFISENAETALDLRRKVKGGRPS